MCIPAKCMGLVFFITICMKQMEIYKMKSRLGYFCQQIIQNLHICLSDKYHVCLLIC